MGIHLHKAIGWAAPCDSDPLDRDARSASLTLYDHAVWLRAAVFDITDETSRDDVLYRSDLLRKAPNRHLSSCVIHIPSLDGGTLLLIPPTYLGEWSRMDDDLDCAFAEGEPASDRITYTRANPFAFSHLWMDAVTGRSLSGPAGDAVTLRGTERGNQAAVRIRFQGETEPAYSDPEEAAQHVVPGIPREIEDLTRHLGSFPDPQMLLKLRPARAVWLG